MLRLLAVTSLALVACASGPTNALLAPSPTSEARSALIYALLSDGHLLVARAEDGSVVADIVLMPSPRMDITWRHVTGVSPDRRTVYVLVEDVGLRAAIYAIDTSTHTAVRTIDLITGPDYRALAVGARSGLIFVFGNEDGAATVWVADPSGHRPVRRMPARSSDGGPWSVYQGTLTPDETHLFLSYHGPTTGIDRFEIRDERLVRCPPPVAPGHGCLSTHGAMYLFKGRLFAATGEGPLLALDPTTGETLAAFDVQLEGNHIVEFAIDEVRQRIYVVGSCDYVGGLAVVELRGGATRILAPPGRDSSPCGERISVTPDGTRLVVAQKAVSPLTGSRGRLLVLTDTGTAFREIRTNAEPIDILVTPAVGRSQP